MKVALVTGAGKRLGAAIAVALGQHGYCVAAHYNESAAGAATTVADIETGGGNAWPVQADLTDPAHARALVDHVLDKHGGIDLLVANAASFERMPLDDIDDNGWQRTIDLNLRAAWLLSQRASASLRQRQGNIVLVTCTSATRPFRNYLPYVVGKGGLRHLMRTLAVELAPDVRVNAVAPGTVLPPEDMTHSAIEALGRAIPLGRIGSADDVARAVVFLSQASFVTGQELIVDGGRSLCS